MVKVRNSLGVLNSNRSGATGSWDVWGKILAETLWYLAYWYVLIFSSVQLLAQSCPTLCDPMNRSTPGLPVHHQLPESTQTMSVESMMPSNHLILCHPLLLLPSIFPSIRVFSNESALLMRWPKYWSFSLNISPSNEHPWPISFRMDWLDLLAVQGTLKSLLQHSSKASIIQCSAFFRVQLADPYMTTEKTIALTRWTFVGKVMSLLFRLVITFLPRSNRLLISLLQLPSAVILEPRKIKSAIVSPSICHEVMGPDAMILVFWMLSSYYWCGKSWSIITLSFSGSIVHSLSQKPFFIYNFFNITQILRTPISYAKPNPIVFCFLVTLHGIWDPRLPIPLHWKHGVLTTRTLGKSLSPLSFVLFRVKLGLLWSSG